MSHQILGLKAHVDLRQTYIRCTFDYFSPAIAGCGWLGAFNHLFTKSLKLSLCLPTHTLNDRAIYASGVPSLHQIAGYHLERVSGAILVRYSSCPSTVITALEMFRSLAGEYQALTYRPQFDLSLDDNKSLLVDFLRLPSIFTKQVVGLATGNFLTLRHENLCSGSHKVGDIKSCLVCKSPATQRHFLNNCPINEHCRRLLQHCVPPSLLFSSTRAGDLHSVFTNARSLSLQVSCPSDASTEADALGDLIQSGLLNIGLALEAVASLLVENSLKLFSEKTSSSPRAHTPPQTRPRFSMHPAFYSLSPCLHAPISHSSSCSSSSIQTHLHCTSFFLVI